MVKSCFKTGVIPFVFIILFVFIVSFSLDIRSIWVTVENYPLGKALLCIAQAFFVIHLLVFIWRVVLCVKYKPVAPCDDEELPTCTVIVPAYNEGVQVYNTIQSIVQSNYPPEKISIIAVDDGSSDDTWHWLRKAKKKFSGRIALFKQPVNRGKRHALHIGFTKGRGDVFVTIDSDSVVTADTIRHLVSPFCRNSRVGAVAGNVRILNQNQGIIPKMLEVSFAFSFDFLRAGQSVINSVMCTPGALSAYRRDIVMTVLQGWLTQRFCGRQANIGEDRAMTNLILRKGYFVSYQRDAMVYTASPVSFVKLWKMLLRWARSNVRETIVITKFVFKKFRNEGALGLRINVLLNLMNMTMGQILHISAALLLILIPLAVAPKLMLGVALASCVPGIFYATRYEDSINAVWAVPYSFLWTISLSWISLYALMTPHKNGWMTRDLKAKEFIPLSTPTPLNGLPSLTYSTKKAA